jgi:transposase
MGKKLGSTKYQINLKQKEREEFLRNQTQGVHPVRLLRRQKILLLADDKRPLQEIVDEVGTTLQTVYNTLKRYFGDEEGTLSDKPRSGRPEKVSGKVKAQIIATACTDAPGGRSRWTLRLLADHVVQLELLESVSKDTVGRILKKTN